jgi:HD superfamily phosphodiesterase
MQFNNAKQFILDKLASELPAELSYHSVDHIRDVYTACEYLARAEHISGEDLELLLTAALYHDSGFLVQSEHHEAISCNIVRTYLPGFEYSAEQVEIICGMIMATRLPQSPQTKLQEILCDADLDYLGRDDFYSIGNKLYTEFKLRRVVNSEDEWNKVQLKFLQSHHYFTTTANKLRKQKKDDHLSQIRTKVQAHS